MIDSILLQLQNENVLQFQVRKKTGFPLPELVCFTLTPKQPMKLVTRPCTSKLEISREAPQNVTAVCAYCLQPSCIAFYPFKPQGRSHARITNHTKRQKDYKWYWRTLKDCGLWENPIYQQKKEELGCHIDDVRGHATLCNQGCQRKMAKSTQRAVPGAQKSMRKLIPINCNIFLYDKKIYMFSGSTLGLTPIQKSVMLQ